MTVITSQSRTAQHTKNTKKRHTNGLKYVRKRYIGPKICRKKNSTYCNFRQSYSFVGIDTVTRRERCTLVENMHINICAKQNTLHLCACLCHCACVEHKYRTCMNLNTNNVNKRHVRLCAVVLAFQGIASNNEKNEKKKQQYAPCSKKAFLRTPVRRVRTTRACCILTVGLEASIGTTQSHENNFGFGNEKKKKNYFASSSNVFSNLHTRRQWNFVYIHLDFYTNFAEFACSWKVLLCERQARPQSYCIDFVLNSINVSCTRNIKDFLSRNGKPLIFQDAHKGLVGLETWTANSCPSSLKT